MYTHRKRVRFGKGMIEGLCIAIDTILGGGDPAATPNVSDETGTGEGVSSLDNP